MSPYMTEELKKEEKKIIDIMLNSDEELTMDEFVEKYASDKYKDYLRAERKRQDELQKSNSMSMKQIVDPLKETLQKMETVLKETNSTQETSTAAIKEKIATLVATTMKVSDSAERLSNALTAESKTQGCWGEQKIEALYI